MNYQNSDSSPASQEFAVAADYNGTNIVWKVKSQKSRVMKLEDLKLAKNNQIENKRASNFVKIQYNKSSNAIVWSSALPSRLVHFLCSKQTASK